MACGRNQEGKEARGLRHISEGQKGAAKSAKPMRPAKPRLALSLFYEPALQIDARKKLLASFRFVLNDPNNKQLLLNPQCDNFAAHGQL